LFWVVTGLLAGTSLPVVVGQNIAKFVSTLGASAFSFLALRHVVFRPRSR
jgi:hypothetical protein